MSTVELRFHKYRYFPYEEQLAELEAERLLGVSPERVNGSLYVEAQPGLDLPALERLTYFQDAIVPEVGNITTQQAKLEASATSHGNPNQLRRQQTRYSAHGLHEYRGKFNPQMVRATCNLLGLRTGARVWDPFCGSGTVLLEARHQGFDALGTDLNPLAVTIANAKLSAIEADPATLGLAVDDTRHYVEERTRTLVEGNPSRREFEQILGRSWLDGLPCAEFLSRWFPMPVLAQLAVILDAIDRVVPLHLRGVFRVVLSDILRQVSWQDPGDLRVRRRREPSPNYPAASIFLSALCARVGTVIAAQEFTSPRRGWQEAFLGDSCSMTGLGETPLKFLEDGVDCVLSSPPYATALPYIDTQRLSIAILGLASVQEIRQLDATLVGSREVSTVERQEVEQSIVSHGADVACEVRSLCQSLLDAYDPSLDGFRRRNTAAVVFRYFTGMTGMMRAAAKAVRTGGCLAFIVGPNRAKLGGTSFLIDTPGLLAATGVHVGLRVSDVHELNAYNRYSIHSRNSIREERLLILQKQ
ncbi:MAG: hypothetical protein OXK79_04780 [Chloroflexota bacterium]|nr:hypothetical protein [Chloroflexota bacterium]